MSLKITATVTDDLYPETTTVDVQVTDGSAYHAMTKHLPKSYFWSDYERATHSIMEELRLAAMKREKQ